MYFTFVVTRGSSYKSDLALDDVLLRPDECQVIPEAPTMPKSHKQMKIENERIATWKPLGTTQKYSYTTPAPDKPAATPAFVVKQSFRQGPNQQCVLKFDSVEGYDSRSKICCAGHGLTNVNKEHSSRLSRVKSN